MKDYPFPNYIYPTHQSRRQVCCWSHLLRKNREKALFCGGSIPLESHFSGDEIGFHLNTSPEDREDIVLSMDLRTLRLIPSQLSGWCGCVVATTAIAGNRVKQQRSLHGEGRTSILALSSKWHISAVESQ